MHFAQDSFGCVWRHRLPSCCRNVWFLDRRSCAIGAAVVAASTCCCRSRGSAAVAPPIPTCSVVVSATTDCCRYRRHCRCCRQQCNDLSHRMVPSCCKRPEHERGGTSGQVPSDFQIRGMRRVRLAVTAGLLLTWTDGQSPNMRSKPKRQTPRFPSESSRHDVSPERGQIGTSRCGFRLAAGAQTRRAPHSL